GAARREVVAPRVHGHVVVGELRRQVPDARHLAGGGALPGDRGRGRGGGAGDHDERTGQRQRGRGGRGEQPTRSAWPRGGEGGRTAGHGCSRWTFAEEGDPGLASTGATSIPSRHDGASVWRASLSHRMGRLDRWRYP